MNSTLKSILSELDQLVSAVNALPNDEPFSVTHNNWSFPGLTKSELSKAAGDLAELIRTRGPADLGTHEKLVADYVRRLSFLRTSTVPNLWGNAGAGVPNYLLTLNGLSKALDPVLKNESEVASELSQTSKRVLTRLRALETRLSDAEPRTGRLTEMVQRIELAYQAADQLPADLQTLAEDRAKVAELLKFAKQDYTDISKFETDAGVSKSNLTKMESEAKAALEKCHSAYAAATSQGLATAFSERSSALATSMWVWTIAFVVALVVGAVFGTQRVHQIGELLKNPAMTNWALGVNLFLAALSVGAPIWFGWMATKQINQRFRLSEDYAFKAAVSRAYEGYRKEAARIDKDLEARLLASALNRLDEQPLRFVETDNHGSPWHELASSDLVKAALSTIPGFAEKMPEFARTAIQTATAAKPAANDAAKVVTPSTAEAPKT